MKTICPHCKQEYPETPDEYLGITLQCSVCEKEFVCEKVNTRIVPPQSQFVQPHDYNRHPQYSTTTDDSSKLPVKYLLGKLIKYTFIAVIVAGIGYAAWYNSPANKQKRADKEAELKRIQNTYMANHGETDDFRDELKRLNDKVSYKKSTTKDTAENCQNSVRNILQNWNIAVMMFKNSTALRFSDDEISVLAMLHGSLRENASEVSKEFNLPERLLAIQKSQAKAAKTGTKIYEAVAADDNAQKEKLLTEYNTLLNVGAMTEEYKQKIIKDVFAKAIKNILKKDMDVDKVLVALRERIRSKELNELQKKIDNEKHRATAVRKKQVQELKDKKITSTGPIVYADIQAFFTALTQSPATKRASVIEKSKAEKEKLNNLKKERNAVADTAPREHLAQIDEKIKQQEVRVKEIYKSLDKAWCESTFFAGIDNELYDVKNSFDIFGDSKPGRNYKLLLNKAQADEDLQIHTNLIKQVESAMRNAEYMSMLDSGKSIKIESHGQHVEFASKQALHDFIRKSETKKSDLAKKIKQAEYAIMNAYNREADISEYARMTNVDVATIDINDKEFNSWIVQRNEAKKQKAIQEENKRQYEIYKNSVFGKREFAQIEYDNAVARCNANKNKIEQLSDNENRTAAEEKELQQAKALQSMYERFVVRRKSDLNEAIRKIIARQRAGRRGLLGDGRLLSLSEEDYEKERKENENRIAVLEKQKTLSEEEKKEFSRRKYMTRVLFAETDLRKFYRNRQRLQELQEKKANGRTLTAREEDELKRLGSGAANSSDKIVKSLDKFHFSQNGGKSFETLQKEEEKAKRRIKMDNIGVKRIRYNKQTGRYESY